MSEEDATVPRAFFDTRRSECAANLSRPDAAIRWWSAIAAIVVAAMVLRLAAINVQSFWYDEAVAAHLAQQDAGKLLSGIERDNGNPPLYWVVLSLCTFDTSHSEIALRLPSVLFGILTVPIVALLARDSYGERAGIIAAIIFALSPLSLDLSTEARAYPLLQLLAAANILAFLRWVDTRSSGYWLAYALTLAAACLTHYYAAFLPISQGAALLLCRREWPVLLRWAAAGILAAAIGSFWVPAFVAQMGTSGNLSRMGDRWPYQFIVTPLAFAFGRTLVWRDSSQAILATASLAAVVLLWLPAVLACYGSLPIVRKLGGPTDSRHVLASCTLGLCVVATLIIPLLAAIAGTPMFHHRAASVALPALIVLASGGLARLHAKWCGLLLGSLLCLSAISIYNYFRTPLRDDWRSASQYMLERLEDTQLVLFDSDIEVASFGYYAKQGGRSLPNTVGLISGLTDGKLEGIRLPSADRRVENFVDEIAQQSTFWLTTCVPATPTSEYVSFFGNLGFVPKSRQEFHRIDVLEFERRPAAEGGQVARPGSS